MKNLIILALWRLLSPHNSYITYLFVQEPERKFDNIVDVERSQGVSYTFNFLYR